MTIAEIQSLPTFFCNRAGLRCILCGEAIQRGSPAKHTPGENVFAHSGCIEAAALIFPISTTVDFGLRPEFMHKRSVK